MSHFIIKGILFSLDITGNYVANVELIKVKPGFLFKELFSLLWNATLQPFHQYNHLIITSSFCVLNKLINIHV